MGERQRTSTFSRSSLTLQRHLVSIGCLVAVLGQLLKSILPLQVSQSPCQYSNELPLKTAVSVLKMSLRAGPQGAFGVLVPTDFTGDPS